MAIELRRRLGATVPKLVLMEWPILEAPPPFQEGGASGCAVGRTMARDRRTDVLAMVARCEKPQVNRFCPGRDGLLRLDMWSRSAREISRSYSSWGSPLKALVGLQPALPVMHLYAQPDDAGFLAAQQAFASEHPWFQVKKLDAHSHFQCSKCPATLFKPSRRSWQSPPDLTEAVRDSSASAPRRSVAGQAVARVSCPWVTVSFHAIACQCKSWTNRLQIWDNSVLSLQV